MGAAAVMPWDLRGKVNGQFLNLKGIYPTKKLLGLEHSLLGKYAVLICYVFVSNVHWLFLTHASLDIILAKLTSEEDLEQVETRQVHLYFA